MMSIEEIKERTAPLFRKYNVEKAYLFGSQARGDATEDSDFDIRIEGDNPRGLFALGGLFNDLEDVFGEDNVDLITAEPYEDSNDKEFWDDVLRHEILIYG